MPYSHVHGCLPLTDVILDSLASSDFKKISSNCDQSCKVRISYKGLFDAPSL